jgi:hypothetical protein
VLWRPFGSFCAVDREGRLGPTSHAYGVAVALAGSAEWRSAGSGRGDTLRHPHHLAQIGDAAGVHRVIARGLVVVRRHEDDRTLRSRCRNRRCSSIPEIPPRWMSSSRQVAVCARPLSSNASAEANVRLSMPLWANSRATPFRKPALSSTTITTVGCAAISVSRPPVRYLPRVVATLDLDQRNLVHCEQSGCVERPPN